MADDKITSLSGFIQRMRTFRDMWQTSDEKELWFRGENERHPTFLRPILYRPRKDAKRNDLPLKPVRKLLKIENELYDEFRRCAVQLRNEQTPEGDWDWDSYFLMQHHGAATRLLDWSDGALMALHFALGRKPREETTDAIAYVLEPTKMVEQLENRSEWKALGKKWKVYVKRHPNDGLDRDEPEYVYLPATEKDFREVALPMAPLLLDFPHISRRVAAQRSRFIVLERTLCGWRANRKSPVGW